MIKATMTLFLNTDLESIHKQEQLLSFWLIKPNPLLRNQKNLGTAILKSLQNNPLLTINHKIKAVAVIAQIEKLANLIPPQLKSINFESANAINRLILSYFTAQDSINDCLSEEMKVPNYTENVIVDLISPILGQIKSTTRDVIITDAITAYLNYPISKTYRGDGVLQSALLCCDQAKIDVLFNQLLTHEENFDYSSKMSLIMAYVKSISQEAFNTAIGVSVEAIQTAVKSEDNNVHAFNLHLQVLIAGAGRMSPQQATDSIDNLLFFINSSKNPIINFMLLNVLNSYAVYSNDEQRFKWLKHVWNYACIAPNIFIQNAKKLLDNLGKMVGPLCLEKFITRLESQCFYREVGAYREYNEGLYCCLAVIVKFCSTNITKDLADILLYRYLKEAWDASINWANHSRSIIHHGINALAGAISTSNDFINYLITYIDEAIAENDNLSNTEYIDIFITFSNYVGHLEQQTQRNVMRVLESKINSENKELCFQAQETYINYLLKMNSAEIPLAIELLLRSLATHINCSAFALLLAHATTQQKSSIFEMIKQHMLLNSDEVVKIDYHLFSIDQKKQCIKAIIAQLTIHILPEFLKCLLHLSEYITPQQAINLGQILTKGSIAPESEVLILQLFSTLLCSNKLVFRSFANPPLTFAALSVFENVYLSLKPKKRSIEVIHSEEAHLVKRAKCIEPLLEVSTMTVS